MLLQVAHALCAGLCTAFALLAGVWCYNMYVDTFQWPYVVAAAGSFVGALAIAVYGYRIWKGLEDFGDTGL